MERDTARKVLDAAMGYSRRIEGSLGLVRQRCDENVFLSYRRFAGRIMGYLFTEIIKPIYDEHPELAPDWYKSKPDVNGKQQRMERSLRADLSLLMDEVDDGIAEMMKLVDQSCSTEETMRHRSAVDEIRAQVIDAKEYLKNIGVADEPQ